MSEVNFMNTDQRAFFLTMWAKSIENMGFGYLLDDDKKPKDGNGKELLNSICSKFEKSGKDRFCSGTACVSKKEGFHLHLGLYVGGTMKPKNVIKFFGNPHLELQRGTKSQLQDYILKKGKWEEKGEDILCVTENMDGIVGHQGARNDLGQIEELINEGFTPSEIMGQKFAYRRYDKMIRDAFFEKRAAETPVVRDVYVEWHCGESGSGKTHILETLIDSYGVEEVYFVTDYEGGGMDKYNGQKVLFLDEFRGQIRFSTLLSILDVYKAQIHCRYTNIIGLWSKVYITSPLPPEQVYKKMVNLDDRENDSMKQLFRRIDTVVYHWKDGNQYKEFRQPMTEYTRYEDIKRLSGNQEFFTPSPEEVEQIRMLFAE